MTSEERARLRLIVEDLDLELRKSRVSFKSLHQLISDFNRVLERARERKD